MSRPVNKQSMRGIPVAARIPQLVYDIIKEKHPNSGDISKLIRALLQKYADGRIIGVRLEV